MCGISASFRRTTWGAGFEFGVVLIIIVVRARRGSVWARVVFGLEFDLSTIMECWVTHAVAISQTVGSRDVRLRIKGVRGRAFGGACAVCVRAL